MPYFEYNASLCATCPFGGVESRLVFSFIESMNVIRPRFPDRLCAVLNCVSHSLRNGTQDDATTASARVIIVITDVTSGDSLFSCADEEKNAPVFLFKELSRYT